MRYVAVVGDGRCTEQVEALAFEMGGLLARSGLVVLSGGLGGVMRAAAQGAKSLGGRTIGLVPGLERQASNEFIDVPIATGLGHMRNYLVVLNADAVVAIEGGFGTLSEIALALKIGRKVIALGRWAALEGVTPAASPSEALGHVLHHLDCSNKDS